MIEPSSLDVDKLPAGIYRTALNGEILYANQALADLLGYADPSALKQVRVQSLYADAEDRESWLREFDNQNDSIVTKEFQWRRLGGQIVKLVDTARAIRNGKEIIWFDGVIQDLSKTSVQLTTSVIGIQERSVSHYGQTQETKDMLMDFLPVCVIRKDESRRFTFVNRNFCDVESVSREEVLNSRYSDRLMWNSEIDEKYRPTDEEVLKTGKTLEYTEQHLYADQRTLEVHVLKIPIFAQSSAKPVGLEVYYWDSETLAYKNFDHQQARLIEQLFNATGVTAVYEHDFDGVFSYLSPAALALLQLRVKPDRLTVKDVIAPEYLEIVTSQIRAKKTHKRMPDTLTTYEIEVVTPIGRRIPVEVNSRSIFRQGKRSTVVGYVRDLSREKEWLKERLQEVNHRVKNNLNTVVALLDREIPSASEESRSTLLDCKSRVYAIADLHEELYRTNRTNQVEVYGSLNRLIDSVVETYRRPWQDIDVRKHVDNSIVLSLDAMVPLVLIVQEIISNAFKHAFPRKKNDEASKTRGVVFVSFGSMREEVNRHYLLVHDTGVGLPSDFRLDDCKSLGMKLIYGLVVRQLKGTVEVFMQQGTYFKIEFSDPTPVVHIKGINK